MEYVVYAGMYLVYAGTCIMVTEFIGAMMLEHSHKLVGLMDKFFILSD